MVTHIQIGDVTPRIQYMADGVQTEFTYPFPIFKDADLKAYLNDALQTTGYTVAGAGASAGGSATFDVAPSAGVVVTLARRVVVERLSDFQESGEFRSKVLNDELDYLTAAVQQVTDDQSRSAQMAVTETASVNVTFPSPDASRVIAWNGAADGFVNGPTVSQVESAQSSAVSALASAESAQVSADAAATAQGLAEIAAAAASTAAASNMYSSNENKSADFTVLPTDDGKQFLIDTSAGVVTVTLPEGVTAIDGFRFALAKTSADNNAVVVNRVGTDTINGGTSWQFSVPHGQSVIALDTTPAPDTWFAAGVGVVTPVGVADMHDNAKPYDIAFIAGFDTTMVAENIVVQNYGELVVPRALTVTGEAGYLDVAATGQSAIVDIEKNGVSIYSVKPQFAVSANALTAGTLSTTAFAAGDRLSLKVTQTGTTAAGQGLRFTLKTVLA